MKPESADSASLLIELAVGAGGGDELLEEVAGARVELVERRLRDVRRLVEASLLAAKAASERVSMWSVTLRPVADPRLSPTSAMRDVTTSLFRRTRSCCMRWMPVRGVPSSDAVEIVGGSHRLGYATASRSVWNMVLITAISFDDAW